MPTLEEFTEHTQGLFPGAVTACCIDDMEGFSLEELYCFPIRFMQARNQEELLCLILTPISGNSDMFPRVRLLTLAKDEIDGLEWANGEWNKSISGLSCISQIIQII